MQSYASWERGFESRLIQGYMKLFMFVCCVGNGLCDELVTPSEESYPVCLCLTVCDLGTSTNSHPSLQFGCSTTARK